MGSPASSSLRQMLEGQLSLLSSEVERLFEEARGRARRELADQLNQSVRRIRQAGSLDELTTALLDAAAPFATGAAIFRVAGSNLTGDRIRGVASDSFDAFEIPISSAPALAGAVETRDPVTAVTTPGEVSAEIVALASHPVEGRAFIFPLVVKERVPALLYAWGGVQGPAIEMLAQIAAAVWHPLEPAEPAQLVNIAIAPAPVPAPASAWDALSPDDQAIHLRAQRFARVQVAEMHLREAAAVDSGRARRDLYGALRERIDSARAAFHQSYFTGCSNMVDYLHVELVRTLAHDDADLLGKDYPGPLV